MMKAQLVIKNAHICMGDNIVEGCIVVNDGKITSICSARYIPEGETVIDAEGLLVLPGTIDTHVHLRDPGNPERETFKTGTMAAACGGVTSILEHPISKPPQYSQKILRKRIEVARPQSLVDYAFFGAAGGEYLDKISEIAKEGIVAYKTFLHGAPKGREEEFIGLTMKNDYEIYEGFSEIAKTGLMCAVHAENNDLIVGMMNKLKNEGRKDARAHAEARPPISEIETVDKIIHFAKATGVSIDFCHISTPESMELIMNEKAKGYPFYIETCPHYLLLNEDDLEKFGPFAKCNPPLRKKENVEKLWDYVRNGAVDFIGSDHAPFLLEEKIRGLEDIFDCPSGFPGIDLRLPLMLNAVNEGKLTLKRVIDLLSLNPAKAFNLYPKKGTIQINSDADFAIVDMKKKFTVAIDNMYSKAKGIAKVYEGLELTGMPVYTIVRGKVVMKNGIVDETAAGWGELLTPLSKK